MWTDFDKKNMNVSKLPFGNNNKSTNIPFKGSLGQHNTNSVQIF